MSTTALTIATTKQLTADDLQILKSTKFKGFDDAEIAYSAKIANQLALSPFLNQVHFVKRKNKDGSYSIAAQTGIDGFRLTAQRAGGYAGCDETDYEYMPSDQLKKKPIKAKVTVYRLVEGVRCAFSGEARWDEFYNPVGGQWDKMPHVMLSKCAESQALRKAFPAELSGLHTDEEMDQASAPTKAQDLQAKIIPAEATPVGAAVLPTVAQTGNCIYCQSSNTMISRYRDGAKYCRDCKKEF